MISIVYLLNIKCLTLYRPMPIYVISVRAWMLVVATVHVLLMLGAVYLINARN